MSALSPIAQNPFRCLVVDDSLFNRKMFCITIEKASKECDCPYICDTAGSGLEAIDLCDKHEYNVIVMDYHMEPINGAETARRILALKPGVKILGCTSTENSEDIENCIQAGMKEVLPKDSKKLKELIKDLMKDYILAFSSKVTTHAT